MFLLLQTWKQQVAALRPWKLCWTFSLKVKFHATSQLFTHQCPQSEIRTAKHGEKVMHFWHEVRSSSQKNRTGALRVSLLLTLFGVVRSKVSAHVPKFEEIYFAKQACRRSEHTMCRHQIGETQVTNIVETKEQILLAPALLYSGTCKGGKFIFLQVTRTMSLPDSYHVGLT